MSYRNYLNEVKFDWSKHTVEVEKSKFGGFVPVVLNGEGKLSYSGKAYEDEETALKVATLYLNKSKQGASMNALDRAVALFNDKLYKKKK